MNQRILRFGAALALAGALGACGGNDDGDTATPVTMTPNNTSTPGTTQTSGVPSSALQSVTALVAYVTGLIAQSNDTSEPVVLGDAVLPTSDTTE